MLTRITFLKYLSKEIQSLLKIILVLNSIQMPTKWKDTRLQGRAANIEVGFSESGLGLLKSFQAPLKLEQKVIKKQEKATTFSSFRDLETFSSPKSDQLTGPLSLKQNF